MWLLSCDGEYFGGKRLWLRSGSTHLIGRTSNRQAAGCDRVRYIDHNSVSRRHLVLQIADTTAGDTGRLHSRPVITATDASKKGTIIDDERLSNDTKTLAGPSHRIKLGLLETTFILEWKPIIITVTGIPRGVKARGEALMSERQKLEGADVKLSVEYITNETTHVVGKKRNTAQGLQALVEARWLVTDSFVDALADACRRRAASQEGELGVSPLEEDFDLHWPNEAECTIPTGGEPVSRPNEYLKPDATRESIFNEFTFVFLSQGQHDQLMPVITAGGGKALLHKFDPGPSAVDDTVKFAKELAGKKNSRQFSLSQEPGPGGIVVVRIMDKGEGRDSMAAIETALDQRAIEQSELLDAILVKDTSKFRQRLREESVPNMPSQGVHDPIADVGATSIARPGAAQEPAVVTVSDSPPPQSQRPPRSGQEPQRSQQQPEQQAEVQPIEKPAPPRRNRRQITQSRFKGFDDFDPSQIVKAELPQAQTQEPSQAPDAQAMEVSEQAGQTASTKHNFRKRPAVAEPDEEEETEEQINARLFPAATAAKRRKTEALRNGAPSHSKQTTEVDSAVASLKENDKDKAKKARKKAALADEDIKAKLRAKVQADDEIYRQNEEAAEQMANTDLETYQVEHVIEYFDLPERPAPTSVRTESRDDHPEWNGRRNFKKFRSNKNRDQNNHVPAPETQRTIISLQPVPSKTGGLGDEYWLETGRNHRRKDKPQSQSQSQLQSQPVGPRQVDDPDEDDALAFRRRIRRSREEDADAAEASGIMDQEEAVTVEQSQTQGRKGQATAKRPATKEVAGARAAKRPRQSAATRPTDDDSDDDPMTFRRKRR